MSFAPNKILRQTLLLLLFCHLHPLLLQFRTSFLSCHTLF